MIKLLDDATIDRIAAGEVVERPASVVKELVENSMDAGADAITVEIRGGGVELIRVTDNGSGIEKDDIPAAFLRHATSKISDISDLSALSSMGFRGEALASISAVSRLTCITKRKGELFGYRYEIDGGKAGDIDEIGAPDGTTIVVSKLFYNVPARRKFLKSPTAEANAVAELMEHLSLSRPDISFKFVVNSSTRFMTSGNGELKEVIYRLFGRDTAKEVIPLSWEKDGLFIEGYLGSPVLNRPNRNFENYFLNRRFIRSDIVSKGIEEGYRGYTMQHRFPFCVLNISIDSAEVDVNVHPSKMDVRFSDREGCFDKISEAVSSTLHAREMIPESRIDEEKKEKPEAITAPEPFEEKRRESTIRSEASPEISTKPEPGDEAAAPAEEKSRPLQRDIFDISFDENDRATVTEQVKPAESISEAEDLRSSQPNLCSGRDLSETHFPEYTQLSMLPKERVISSAARKQYRLIGQIFNTYWMFAYQDKLYFVDQHAAHEKVNYEHIVAAYREHKVYKQQLSPPLIVSLSPEEQGVLAEYRDRLSELGFETEDFGGDETALLTTPLDLYRKDPKNLFLDILDDLSLKGGKGGDGAFERVLATMACKASVKGGDEISREEMDKVLDELLTLENPYHCPHGRPTIFSMSRTELERKFKRIVN